MVRSSDGVFCSDECHRQFVTFHNKTDAGPRGPGFGSKLIRFVILVGVVFGILYVLARWGEIEVLRQLMRWLGIDM